MIIDHYSLSIFISAKNASLLIKTGLEHIFSTHSALLFNL